MTIQAKDTPKRTRAKLAEQTRAYLHANAETLALAADSSPAYIRQIATGFRRASFSLAWKLENLTGGKISRFDLRPDIFGLPEKSA